METRELYVLENFRRQMEIYKEKIEEYGYEVCECMEQSHIDAVSPASGNPVAIAPIHTRIDPIKLKERISAIRVKFPSTEVLGMFVGNTKYSVSEIYGWGVSHIFQVPFEEELLINKLFELQPLEMDRTQLSLDTLTRVNINDIEQYEKMPFDLFIFLPVNQKTIKYIDEGQSIDQKTVEKFKKNRHYNLYVRKTDIGKYQAAAAQELGSILHSETLQKEEKTKVMVEGLKGFMTPFFNNDGFSQPEGKQLLNNLDQVLDNLDDVSGEKGEMVSAAIKWSSESRTNLSHSRNVASYCCLFGLALGFDEPQTMRMGGFLHDIGLSNLEPEIIGKDMAQLSEDQQSQYKLHPGNAKIALEEKFLKLPEDAYEMVLYHHEHPDGSGYPYGKKADDIPPFAKICAFADVFDKLTSVRPGCKHYTPEDAMRRIAGLDGRPAEPIYDPEFHRPIIEAYLEDKQLVEDDPSLLERSQTSFEEQSLEPGKMRISHLIEEPRFKQAAVTPPRPLGPDSKDIEADLFEQLKAHFSSL